MIFAEPNDHPSLHEGTMQNMESSCRLRLPATAALDAMLKNRRKKSSSAASCNGKGECNESPTIATCQKASPPHDFSDMFRSVLGAEDPLFDFPEISWTSDENDDTDNQSENAKNGTVVESARPLADETRKRLHDEDNCLPSMLGLRRSKLPRSMVMSPGGDLFHNLDGTYRATVCDFDTSNLTGRLLSKATRDVTFDSDFLNEICFLEHPDHNIFHDGKI